MMELGRPSEVHLDFRNAINHVGVEFDPSSADLLQHHRWSMDKAYSYLATAPILRRYQIEPKRNETELGSSHRSDLWWLQDIDRTRSPRASNSERDCIS